MTHAMSAAAFGARASTPHMVGSTVDLTQLLIEESVSLVDCAIANVDVSGTRFAAPVRFVRSRFLGLAWFKDCAFEQGVDFTQCVFENDLRLDGATVGGDLVLSGAELRGIGGFDRASVAERAHFDDVTAFGNLSFAATTFRGPVTFRRTQCLGGLWLDGSNFLADADFSETDVHGRAWLRAAAPVPGASAMTTYGYIY